jgi:hypothetical protein
MASSEARFPKELFSGHLDGTPQGEISRKSRMLFFCVSLIRIVFAYDYVYSCCRGQVSTFPSIFSRDESPPN